MPDSPLSTYRVQLHQGFPFTALTQQLQYLHDLGIDCIYASPVFAADPGSTHGYDVTAYTLNPELGTEQDWQALHAERKRLGMRWLQDIVPNHMAYSVNNPWIQALFKHGEASLVAKHFDIDWRHPEFRGKVLLPILGSSLPEDIKQGNVKLNTTGDAIRVYEQELPLSARSLSKFPDLAKADIHDVLDAQHYKLDYWQVTNGAINFRRFFTVNGLICLRQERPETFRATHELVLKWIKDGLIDGLRLDHIDGLLDPTGYLKNLRNACGDDVFILVEKILEPNESLPEVWSIQGTTGYDFLSYTNQILRQPAAHESLTALYDELVPGEQQPLTDTIFDNKMWMLEHRMAGELDNLVHHAVGGLAGLPLSVHPDLKAAISYWLCGFSRYRAYPRRGRFQAHDRELMVAAVDRGLSAPNAPKAALQMLRSWLRSITSIDGKTQDFLQRAMQLSGPLMAKGIEDSTFYQHFSYLACNEVGDSPSLHHALNNSEFHDRMIERSLTDMNASSTHDTKRGEDARARLHTMSALPKEWSAFAKTCFELPLVQQSQVPPELVYQLIQTIVGAAPDATNFLDSKATNPLTASRLQEFTTKALRESKSYSNWSDHNDALEQQYSDLAAGLLLDTGFAEAYKSYNTFAAPLAWLNTIRTQVLKATCPGFPDYYQGAEFYDYSLVDPDNRRPVDYDSRSAALQQERQVGFWRKPHKTAKQALICSLLYARKAQAEVWRKGQYVPVRVEGPKADEVLCYRRVFGDDSALVLVAIRNEAQANWPSGDYFADCYVQLPDLGAQVDAITGREINVAGRVAVANLLHEGPAAVYQSATSLAD